MKKDFPDVPRHGIGNNVLLGRLVLSLNFPGVGALTSLAFSIILGDVNRFQCAGVSTEVGGKRCGNNLSRFAKLAG